MRILLFSGLLTVISSLTVAMYDPHYPINIRHMLVTIDNGKPTFVKISPSATVGSLKQQLASKIPFSNPQVVVVSGDRPITTRGRSNPIVALSDTDTIKDIRSKYHTSNFHIVKKNSLTEE